ncbi:transferase [Desulfobacterales bacterium HSG16]|nr:transferase [Desulfobacterales bacterium HSG16]
MKELNTLLDRIIQRVNIDLREINYNVEPFVRQLVTSDQMTKFYAFYGITPNHPLNLNFKHSNLSGSYFLGKSRIANSLLYKTDIRGDELKKKNEIFGYKNFKIPVNKDEGISIDDSFLIKTLVHNFSHDPETLETFFIRDTISTHYANIHGSPSDGCFLGPFSTVDLTTMRDCLIGTYSYVQAGEISHLDIKPGTLWIRQPDEFNFIYRYPLDQLNEYIYFTAGRLPQGILMDFTEDRKEAFQRVFERVDMETTLSVPSNASLDRYAVVKPKTRIGENVLVAQRAYLQNSSLGKGANAQENCYIINSTLQGNNVTAHGAKIIEADLGKNVFVGFNSFLRGRPNYRLTIGQDTIIMPHTIIDNRKPLSVPPNHLVWGMVKDEKDLARNSLPLNDFSKIDSHFSTGNMLFEGSGAAFVTAFKNRIQHILEANGAFFNGTENKGHAQQNQNISFNIIQPYPDGDKEGLYPTIHIRP